jgi:RND family efflux transporter MFP subunit
MTRRISILLALGAATVASCSKQPELNLAPSRPALRVATLSAQRQSFQVGYRASGTVRGHSTATLTAKGLGHVRAVHVRSGDWVRQGQLLIELEANDVRAGVARARASLSLATAAKLEAENGVSEAKANASLARTSRERSEQLFNSGAISRQAFDEAETRQSSTSAQEQVAQARVTAAESSIQAARAAIAEAEAQLGYTQLSAPFNGRVLERLVDPGVLASVGTPLLNLADDGAARVEAFVPESYATQIKLGDTVQLELDGTALTHAGKVGEIVANVDTRSRTFLVKVDLPDGAGDFRPGTFARVTFPSGSESRLVVPTAALDHFGALTRIFVVEGERAQLRMLTTGEQQAAWTSVLSGLSEGERVVVSPPAALRDSDRVEVAP